MFYDSATIALIGARGKHRNSDNKNTVMITQLKPPAHLSPFIECFWLYSSAHSYQGFPQGVFDIIFSPHGFSYRNHVNKQTIAMNSGNALVGIHTQGFELSGAQPTIFIGVRLKAFALFCANDIDVAAITNGCQQLQHLGIKAPNNDALFSESLASDHPLLQLQQASQALIPWLEHCFYPVHDHDYQQFRAQTNVLLFHRGNIQVNRLCEEFKTTKVTLRKHFLKHSGVTAKEMCHIWQINQFLVAANNAEQSNVVELALEAGFYDQAHLTHRFKQAFGTTPKRFFANNTQHHMIQAGLMQARFVGEYDPF